MQEYKRCSKCGQEYQATTEYFPKRTNRPSGLASHCKQCDRARCNDYDERNREKRRSYDVLHKEDKKINSAQRYIENRGKILSHNYNWAKNNPDKVRARARLHTSKRKARKKGLPDSLSMDDWQIALEFFLYRCAYCGRPQGFWNPICADHFVPLSDALCPGTVSDNIIPACLECNSSKHNRHAEEWLVWKFGRRKASMRLKRIMEYFQCLKELR